MSWFSWLFGGEDPVDQCGWKILRLVRNPEDDPYLPACVVDDRLTTEGGWGESHLTLSRLIQNFLDEVNEIQKDFNPDSWQYALGERYKSIYPHVISWFFEGKS